MMVSFQNQTRVGAWHHFFSGYLAVLTDRFFRFIENFLKILFKQVYFKTFLLYLFDLFEQNG